jgi:putative FmdB family regulatory protein
LFLSKDAFMPIYAYACADCAHEFETLVRSNESPACPECGSARLDRQISLIAKPASGCGSSSARDAAPACAAMEGGEPCGGCPAFDDMSFGGVN